MLALSRRRGLCAMTKQTVSYFADVASFDDYAEPLLHPSDATILVYFASFKLTKCVSKQTETVSELTQWHSLFYCAVAVCATLRYSEL